MASRIKKYSLEKAKPKSIADLVKLRNTGAKKKPKPPSTIAMPSSELADKMEELKEPKKKLPSSKGITEKSALESSVDDSKPTLSIHVFGMKGG